LVQFSELLTVMLLVLFVLGLFSFISNGAKYRGTVNVRESDGFAFLGKFCFQDIATPNFTSHKGPAAGLIDVELTNSDDTGALYYLMMYDDQDNSWPKMYDKGLSCEEMASDDYTKAEVEVLLNGLATYEKTIPIHQHIRPRWWWLYLTNCDWDINGTDTSSDIEFEIHFTQNTTAWLEKEVGSNDQGLSLMYSVYLGVYIILFGVQMYSYYAYTIQQYIHQVIKLLTATIGLQLFAVIFNFADWIIYTESGEHEIFFPIIATLFEVLAQSVFLLLLLVLAQGWTVSRFEVVYPKTLLGGSILCAIVQCSLYIWLLVGMNDETTTYVYNTAPMYVYGSVVLIVGLIFVGSCIVSWKNESLDSKRNLYILLALFFSVWFFWPLMRILVGNGFNPWVRDVAITSISETVNTISYFIMMLLMWPSWAHQYFNLSMIDTQERILDGDSAKEVGVQGSLNPDYNRLEQDRL